MNKRIPWLATAALTLALGGQYVTYRLQAPQATLHASWKNTPKTFAEARGQAKAIVLGEVVAVGRGKDIVTVAPGEPNGEDRIPTQEVKVRVLKGYKGTKAGETLTLFQTGGTVLPTTPPKDKKGGTTNVQQFILEGDPLYKPGEQYLLLLEDGPNGMVRTTSPEGRFQVKSDGTLQPMVDNDTTREVRGKPLAQVERNVSQ